MVSGSKVVVIALVTTTLVSAAEWGYQGDHGPSHWGAVCQAGKSQSPIDIQTPNLPDTNYEAFTFHGYNKELKDDKITNNGHTVQMGFSLHHKQIPPTVTGGGLPGKYQFAQLHFHWGSDDSKGSEHTIDTKTYPLELHLVHFKTEYGSTIGDALTVQATDNLAVLGIMFEIQEKDNPDIKYLIKAIGNQPKPKQSTDMGSVPLADLLPRNTDGFYRYNGSLTTPGCNEVVVWTVFKDPVGISTRQMAKFRALVENSDGKKMVNNFRPVQNLNGRQILDVETSTKRFSSGAVQISSIILPVAISTLLLALLRN